MNILEAIKTGKPFRRNKWVYDEKGDLWCPGEAEWVVVGDDQCALMWETGDTFGDVSLENLLADDYIIKE